MESEAPKLFLIQLKTDCCFIVFRQQAIEHILKGAKKGRKENEQTKDMQELHLCKKNLQHSLKSATSQTI